LPNTQIAGLLAVNLDTPTKCREILRRYWSERAKTAVLRHDYYILQNFYI
jgi:hypothetical protein